MSYSILCVFLLLCNTLPLFTSQDTLECDLCKESLGILSTYVSKYGNDILQFTQPICSVIAPYLNKIIGEVECDPLDPQTCIDLCKGMITSWGPVIADVFVAIELDPDRDCGNIGLCPPVNGSVPIYPKTKLTPSGTVVNPIVGKIFHVSDIHYDRNYMVGTNTNCEMPVCCHVTYGTGPAKKFGDFSCDSPEILVKEMLNQLKTFNPSFLIYSGDTPAHDLWLQTHETNLGAIANVTGWALESLPPQTKFIPALGNHAAAPVDNFGGPIHDYWLYGPTGDLWSKFLPSEAIVSFKWGGYYTTVMEPGLRAIVLQTNYYDHSNLWLDTLTQPDIAGQFAWFGDVLRQIRALGEKAVIIAHEKPASFAPGPYQRWYLDLATEFRDVIKAHFFGHNHCDLFQVLHDPSNNLSTPIGTVFMPSSLTPGGNDTNPSFRLYEYDQSTKTLLDYHQYRADLLKGNQAGYLTWFKAYSARADWGVPDMEPASWQAIGRRIGKNKPDWDFFRFQYHGGLQYYPLEDLDVNQKVAMCNVLGDTDVTYSECMNS